MKSKTTYKLIKILILIIVFFSISQIDSFAYLETTDNIRLASGELIDPDDFKPNDLTGVEDVVKRGSIIVDAIRIIGIIVTVICLMLIGIKYITGSVEEKADYKKSMIPYLIGVGIFFSLSIILTTIIDLVAEI